MAMNTGSLSDPLSPGGGSLGLVAGRRVAECRPALLRLLLVGTLWIACHRLAAEEATLVSGRSAHADAVIRHR